MDPKQDTNTDHPLPTMACHVYVGRTWAGASKRLYVPVDGRRVPRTRTEGDDDDR